MVHAMSALYKHERRRSVHAAAQICNSGAPRARPFHKRLRPWKHKGSRAIAHAGRQITSTHSAVARVLGVAVIVDLTEHLSRSHSLRGTVPQLPEQTGQDRLVQLPWPIS